jgi:hypothetical protein
MKSTTLAPVGGRPLRLIQLLLLLLLQLKNEPSTAFTTSFQRMPTVSSTALSSSSSSSSSKSSTEQVEEGSARRRLVLLGTVTAFSAFFTITVPLVEPAEATYSAYAHREEDWQSRQEKGEIQYSSARQLRNQLKEIAPMNSGSDKIFCPNGPSSAVSPLMENKCGDLLAIPSVYGRTEDVVGNSIPGFRGGRYSLSGRESSQNLPADVGGFPNYYSNSKK